MYYYRQPYIIGPHVSVCYKNSEYSSRNQPSQMYGDNVFEKRGIRRDRTGGSGKGRYLQGKTGIL